MQPVGSAVSVGGGGMGVSVGPPGVLLAAGVSDGPGVAVGPGGGGSDVGSSVGPP